MARGYGNHRGRGGYRNNNSYNGRNNNNNNNGGGGGGFFSTSNQGGGGGGYNSRGSRGGYNGGGGYGALLEQVTEPGTPRSNRLPPRLAMPARFFDFLPTAVPSGKMMIRGQARAEFGALAELLQDPVAELAADHPATMIELPRGMLPTSFFATNPPRRDWRWIPLRTQIPLDR